MPDHKIVRFDLSPSPIVPAALDVSILSTSAPIPSSASSLRTEPEKKEQHAKEPGSVFRKSNVQLFKINWVK